MSISRNNRTYYTKEEYEAAKRNDNALLYAQRQGYDLVRTGRYFYMRQHDSLVFAPSGAWFWNSRGLSGRALEFIVFYEGRSFPEAVLILAGTVQPGFTPRVIPRSIPPPVKQDCPDISLSWEKVSRRITDLIRKGRYLTEQEQAEYDKIQEEKALAESEPELETVGRIEYLGTNGEPGEIVAYTDAEQFVQDIREETYYGAPITVVLCRDEHGQTIPQDFLKELDPPPKGLRVEDAPVLENDLDAIAPGEGDTVEDRQPDASIWPYNGVKGRHPDDIVLYQMGDFFEIYGEDAKVAAPELGLQLVSRAIPTGGRVEMCGFPANRLEQVVEQLRDKHDVTVSAAVEGSTQHREYSLPSIDHEAEQAINAQEAEFGADGTRVFRDAETETAPRYEVVVYHHFENGFDERGDYHTLREAEEAAQKYVDGSMEPDGFAYDGAAVYDLTDKKYLRIYGDYPDEKAQAQVNELTQSNDLQVEMEAWQAQQASEKQDVVDALSEQEQTIVRAMETAGFLFDPQGANPGLNENLVFTAGESGYPVTFQNWEQAYAWIDAAELRDTPGLREQVQQILHPEPHNGVLTNEEYAAVHSTLRERSSYNPAVPPYHVGDTVYLDDRPHQITELRYDMVQLLPTGMSYPIYRLERREQFEQLLRGDTRNNFYTEFLPANLDTVDQDLRDVLAHGLIGEADKAELSQLLHSGKSNREVASWLSRAYPSIVETMELETGDTADYRTTPNGIELEVLDAEEKRLAVLSFRWDEVSPLLRGLYARQLDGSGRERPEQTAEPPAYHAETVAVYPGDKNHLPYDVVVQTLRTNEPEKTLDEVLDEHPISIQVNGEWQTFPNARAAEEAVHEEYKENLRRSPENFHITDNHLGEGGPKAKFQANIRAIQLLRELESTGQQATPEQQEVLSRYVGWGGLADAFDPDKESWSKEYAQLKELLTPEEYAAARSSTLNAHYTSPTIIRAIYDAVGQMGFQTGNILEPAMGIGNRETELKKQLESIRASRKKLSRIAHNCQKAADRRIYNKAYLAKAEHFRSLWYEKLQTEQAVKKELKEVRQQRHDAEKAVCTEGKKRPEQGR